MADHNNRYRRGVGVMLLSGERKVWVGARVAGEEAWTTALSPANGTTTASCGGWAVPSVWVTRCEAVAMPAVQDAEGRFATISSRPVSVFPLRTARGTMETRGKR